MQVFKPFLAQQIPAFRSFSTTACRAKVLYRTVDEVLNYRGPGYRIFPEKILYKLLFKKKKNRPFQELPVGAPSISLQMATQNLVPGKAVATGKRIIILNKLFMRYIPEILSTSEVGTKLYGFDIEFSHVKMSPLCHLLKVYWIPRGTDEDEIVQKLLDEVASPLRAELNNLKLIGIVPQIRFLKNRFHALMAEVDRRLKIADFGENFEPTVITNDILKGQLQLQTNLPNEIKLKISKLETEYPDNEELSIAPMRSDVFGLNYDKIINTIYTTKKKHHSNRLAQQSEETILGSSAIKQVAFDTEAQQFQAWDRKAFLQYIKKEKFKRKKMLKEQSKEFKKQSLEDSITFQNVDEEEDELFIEFVTNAFDDHVEDLDEELHRLPLKY